MTDFKVANVIELVGESTESWDEAVKVAVREAAKTVHHIRGVEVRNLTADVMNGRITSYKANVHVAFGVDNSLRKIRE